MFPRFCRGSLSTGPGPFMFVEELGEFPSQGLAVQPVGNLPVSLVELPVGFNLHVVAEVVFQRDERGAEHVVVGFARGLAVVPSLWGSDEPVDSAPFRVWGVGEVLAGFISHPVEDYPAGAQDWLGGDVVVVVRDAPDGYF